jgi:hypothetical protein
MNGDYEVLAGNSLIVGDGMRVPAVHRWAIINGPAAVYV